MPVSVFYTNKQFYFKQFQHEDRVQFYLILIGLEGRAFASDPGDLGSIPGRVLPKTFKIVLDSSLLNTQQYKVRTKGKVGTIQGKELHPPLHLCVVATEKGAFWTPSTTVANFTLLTLGQDPIRCYHSKPVDQVSDGNKGVIRIPRISCIVQCHIQDTCQMQSVYSAQVPVDQAIINFILYIWSSGRQTASLYHNSSMWRDRLDSRSWD